MCSAPSRALRGSCLCSHGSGIWLRFVSRLWVSSDWNAVSFYLHAGSAKCFMPPTSAGCLDFSGLSSADGSLLFGTYSACTVTSERQVSSARTCDGGGGGCLPLWSACNPLCTTSASSHQFLASNTSLKSELSYHTAITGRYTRTEPYTYSNAAVLDFDESRTSSSPCVKPLPQQNTFQSSSSKCFDVWSRGFGCSRRIVLSVRCDAVELTCCSCPS